MTVASLIANCAEATPGSPPEHRERDAATCQLDATLSTELAVHARASTKPRGEIWPDVLAYGSLGLYVASMPCAAVCDQPYKTGATVVLATGTAVVIGALVYFFALR